MVQVQEEEQKPADVQAFFISTPIDRLMDCANKSSKRTLPAILMEWCRALFYLFFPSRCVICDCLLTEGEEAICLKCQLQIPRTRYHLQPGNKAEQLFWGKIPSLQRVTSYFFYHKGSRMKGLLYAIKYKGRPDVGELMGRYMATEIAPSGFFRDIDLLLPVPLHPKRLRSRGYNQSECLARGISQVTGIPLAPRDVLIRQKHTDTQTHQSAFGRWQNMDGVFQLMRPELLQGRHILLIDDVLTTGATLTACADALQEVPDVRISVLTLAMAAL